MEFEEAVRRRRMVRTYDPDRRVSRERSMRLLELAIRAPSAGFSQGWQFLVLDEPQRLRPVLERDRRRRRAPTRGWPGCERRRR